MRITTAVNALPKWGQEFETSDQQQQCRFGSKLDHFRLYLVGSFNFTFQFIIRTGRTSNEFLRTPPIQTVSSNFIDLKPDKCSPTTMKRLMILPLSFCTAITHPDKSKCHSLIWVQNILYLTVSNRYNTCIKIEQVLINSCLKY